MKPLPLALGFLIRSKHPYWPPGPTEVRAVGVSYCLARPSEAKDGLSRAHMDVLVACRARQYDTAAARI